MNNKWALSILLYFGLQAINAGAIDLGNSRLSGFGTIGAAYSNNEELLFRRDVTQKDGSHQDIQWKNDSLLGLQLDTTWGDQVATTVQLIAKERLEESLSHSIEWAFVRYRPIDSLDIRAGRLGTDIYMLSDYRQVGYAYAWVRPPQEFYGLLSFYHFDGVDIAKRFHFSNAELSTKIFYGNSHETYPLDINATRTYKLNFEGGGITSTVESGDWKARVSYADVELANNNLSEFMQALNGAQALFPPATKILQDYSTKNHHLQYSELGITYDNNRWWIQTEYTDLDSDIRSVPSAKVFYVMAGKRINKFSLYSTYSKIKPATPLVHYPLPVGYPEPYQTALTELVVAAELGINTSRADQHSMGVGLRWDFKPKMSLKFQIDRFFVEPFGGSIWLKHENRLVNDKQDSLVTSASLDFVF